jgi:hypothetical protein
VDRGDWGGHATGVEGSLLWTVEMHLKRTCFASVNFFLKELSADQAATRGRQANTREKGERRADWPTAEPENAY